jgi:hypothetical protein
MGTTRPRRGTQVRRRTGIESGKGTRSKRSEGGRPFVIGGGVGVLEGGVETRGAT